VNTASEIVVLIQERVGFAASLLDSHVILDEEYEWFALVEYRRMRRRVKIWRVVFEDVA
jgi:hypothetical protein